jgi:hypothetical protein
LRNLLASRTNAPVADVVTNALVVILLDLVAAKGRNIK